ncbi:MAG: hypothetical protein IH934_00885 [Nanoarchaeota archaeon]|nr:hypothetical protein [Nanoarchaeota archaeon]
MNLVERVKKSYDATNGVLNGVTSAMSSRMTYNQYFQTSEGMQASRNLQDTFKEVDFVTFSLGSTPAAMKYLAMHPYNAVKILRDVVTKK